MASDPEYYTQAKAADGKKDIQYFTLNQLIGSGENLLIVGNKESGKTMLLHQISLQVLDSEDALVARLPFFINYKDLPKGPRAIEKKLQDYVFDSSVELNVEDNLRSGKCLLLFDDFNREKGKELERLKNFISMHPNNRYIFVMDEDIYKTLELNDMPDLGIKYKCIHIHSFTAERTRKLVQNWFKNMNVDVEEIFEKTMENIWKIKVPRTPFIISLMLWILEIQGNYVPINKASLIEKFVEIILEKLNIHERTYRSLDYRNKEHYLSSIAEKMVDEGKYYFTRLELEKATLEYFDRKGLRVSISPLIEYFLKKGILMEEKEIIYFKYKSFCEYFIARRMIDDKSFYEKIIKVENFLGFENEIDYMTGLQRNNSNLLSLLGQRLEESFRALNVNIGLELFDSIKIQRSILESDEKEAVISRFKSSVMDEGERHKMLDQMYPSEAKDGRKIERVAYADYKTMLMSNLTLYSKVVRNCELIDDLEFKRQGVAKCMESYANLMLSAMVVVENTLKDRPGGKSGKYGDELNYFVKIIIPLVFPYQIYINLGSEKLEKLIDDGIRDSKNPTLIKMLYIMLYGDLKLQGYLDRIRTFVEEIKHNKYILDIIFHKLLIYYMFRKMEKQERKQVEIMVGDIWVHINGTGNRAIDGRNRSKFIYELNLWYLRNLYLIRSTLDNV